MSEITQHKKTGRGGARPGAGRKPSSTAPRLEGWYMYVLDETPSAGFLKIGIANKPYQRLSSAQTSNPRVLRFAGLWSLSGSDCYAAAEKALHKALRPFHVRGEWFEVAVDQVQKHMEEISSAMGLDAKRVL